MKWKAKAKVGRCGRVIAGRYRLEAPLGSGGMGTIWSAEHTGLRSRVAIKFLDAAIADDPEMLERFLREAQSAAAVRGSHVVQIFDCGVDGRDPYIAMELLQGETLDERLTARVRLTPAELNRIFHQVATAVGNAHHLGVIHRDLKPPNIFLAREGELEVAKVLDFGIAKLMNRDLQLAAGTGTRTGTLLGTPSYMSPEQARGSRSLDQATDLWSLAVIAFECLTGQLPFTGKTLGDLVVQICTERPAIPSEVARVPRGFDDWFLKGVSKDPADRFGTAREMAEALQEILTRADATAVNLSSESPSEPTLHSVAPLPTRVLCPASLAPAQLAGAAETGPRARLSSQFSLGWASPALQRLRASAALVWLRRVSPWAAPLALLGAVSMVALWLGAASRERAGSSQQPALDSINAVLGALPPPQRGSELPPPALEGEPGVAASVPAAAPLRRAAEGVSVTSVPTTTPSPMRAEAGRGAGAAATSARSRAAPANTATSHTPATSTAATNTAANDTPAASAAPPRPQPAAPEAPSVNSQRKPSRAPKAKSHADDPFADRL